MEVSFKDFNPNTPIKERYEYIVDYISHDFDLKFEDTFYLIKQLKHNQSSVVIFADAVVDFHIFDNVLHVQIDGEGFWYAENISLEIAREILKSTFEGCMDFGQYIPTTEREWEAYTL
jgi:hypothetical protein